MLKNGEGPVVLVRTDMDALPVVEETGLPYASKVKTRDSAGREVGVMHACGHDIHMTSFIGTARWLADHRDRWAGTVVLIGQPAEEMVNGARAMLEDGLYSRFPKPDFALALHCRPDIPVGAVSYCSGPAMASSTSVSVIVRGKGGHGAWPHRTIDPIVLAALFVVDLQTIVSREIEPGEPAVVTVGSIHGGTKHNIIPDEVKLQLTLRSFSEPVRQQLIAGIKRPRSGFRKPIKRRSRRSKSRKERRRRSTRPPSSSGCCRPCRGPGCGQCQSCQAGDGSRRLLALQRGERADLHVLAGDVESGADRGGDLKWRGAAGAPFVEILPGTRPKHLDRHPHNDRGGRQAIAAETLNLLARYLHRRDPASTRHQVSGSASKACCWVTSVPRKYRRVDFINDLELGDLLLDEFLTVALARSSWPSWSRRNLCSSRMSFPE